MTHPNLKPSRFVRVVLCGIMLVGTASAIAPARADDNDRYWREHQRNERAAEARSRGRGHWDHRYWDRNRDYDRDEVVRVYRPPTVYYAPPPPSGLDFVFRFGR